MNKLKIKFLEKLLLLCVIGILIVLHDVLYVNFSILSFLTLLICAIYFFWWIFKNRGCYLKSLNPPFYLILAISIFVLVNFLGARHDDWVISKVKKWGEKIRIEKPNDSYPIFIKNKFHGNQAYYSKISPDVDGYIFFDLFNFFRKSYDVDKDVYGETKEK